MKLSSRNSDELHAASLLERIKFDPAEVLGPLFWILIAQLSRLSRIIFLDSFSMKKYPFWNKKNHFEKYFDLFIFLLCIKIILTIKKDT